MSAITIQPHFGDADAMIRRIQATPIHHRKERPDFQTVVGPRDVECWNCGTFYENSTRKICKCGEYIDQN